MATYTIVYTNDAWEADGLIWYQTIFQRVTTTGTLIVSLVRAIADGPPAIERAGIFTPIQDKRGQQWKLIRWVQPDELVLVAQQ